MNHNTGTFKTISLGDGLYTIEYTPMPSDQPCHNCLARNNISLCLQMPDECLTENISYVRRMVITGDCE